MFGLTKKDKDNKDKGESKKEEEEDTSKVEKKKVEIKKEEPKPAIEMKPGDYRVQVHILEAKDIKAKGVAGGGGFLANWEGETADPMVEVEILSQKKLTEYKTGQLSPIFNETLYFEFQGLIEEYLETAMIKISLLDHDMIGANNMIGQFTVDMAYIYTMNEQHDLYRMWIAMTDPNDETSEIKGYIKLSINVLGPGDKPPVHDPTKKLKVKDSGKLKLFTPGNVKMSPHIVEIKIFRAEHLTPLDLIENSLDPYVTASFAGQSTRTKVITKDRNPEFNQQLNLKCKLPCMNAKIKLEVWDEDLTSSDRVGTHYIFFKDIQNKSTEPRWANLYGPPIQAEGDYADLMTKFGDKGSRYRGRFLYSKFYFICNPYVLGIATHNQENPKTCTEDLKFSFPSNPSPNPREKSYLLKVALYEGIELPEIDKLCVHVACGPYVTKSKLTTNDNSRAVWNQYLPDMIIRAPDQYDDIYDVIIFLATSLNNSDRICYKRIKAKDLLDINGKEFKIENYLLEEDKSIDPLDDEQFPGIIQARIKLYQKDAQDDFSESIFKSQENYVDYLLHLHIYMGRDFPPADETGAADPFIIARCMGTKQKSIVKYETVNPAYYETLEMIVPLPPIGDPDYPSPGISLLVYDEDLAFIGEKKDLLGRIWIDIEKEISQIKSPVDGKFYPVHTNKQPQWYDLVFDATNQKEGKLYVGYDIIPLEHKDQFPVEKINIRPKSIPAVLSMACIGLRDLVPSIDLFPLKKLHCEFDISGDTKEAVITNQYPVQGNAVSILEIITVNVNIPLDITYAPVLTVYCYDQVMGFLGERLVGVANIPLKKYCKKVVKHYMGVSNAFQLNFQKNSPQKGSSIMGVKAPFKNLKIQEKLKFGNKKDESKGPKEEELKEDEVPEEEEYVGDNGGDVDEKQEVNEIVENNDIILKENKQDNEEQKENQENQDDEDDDEDEQQALTQDEDDDPHQNPKKEENKEKQQKEEKRKTTFKQQMKEKEEKEKEEQKQKEEKRQINKKNQEEEGDCVKEIERKELKQEDYDSQPEEDLDMTPEWIKGRETVESELEEMLGKPTIAKWNIIRGQTRGKATMFSTTVQNTLDITGKFKDIIKLKTKEQLSKKGDGQLQQFLNAKKVIARLYVLKGKSLTPKDENTSDPYLVIKLGKTNIEDKDSLKYKTCNPGFYTSYDIPTTLPGASTLAIEVWDNDGFGFDDLIGITKIDLEDRYFNKKWIGLYPGKKPIEERTLEIKASAAPQGVLQCWLEILEPKEASANPRIDISPPPKLDFEIRLIVWGTRDVAFTEQTTKCNDLFAKAILGDKTLETDTHWRCREKGSFNWRMKFPIQLPLDPDEDYGNDMLTLQLWDRDIATANEMICETKLPLNSETMFRMLDKAYKRKKRVIFKKNNLKTKMSTDRWWIALHHPEATDKNDKLIPQGYCEISLEILPKNLAEEVPNGQGRDSPNQHPVLPEPTGRFSFDLFSPWKMLKELIGPSLARKLCCLVCCLTCCALIGFWGFFIGGDIIAAIITNNM